MATAGCPSPRHCAVQRPGADPAGLSHEFAYVAAALPQLATVAGVVAHNDLRRGQPHRAHVRHGVFLLRGTDVPEGRGVRFAGLRRARTHASLQVPIGCHPAFVHVSAIASPASLPETDGPGWRPEIRSPFASVAGRAGADRWRFGVGHAGTHPGQARHACQP
jgi:hypothetical protein